MILEYQKKGKVMSADQKLSKALVLAGGGVSGVAWELGILTALQRAGIDFSQADLVVGTSAGSVVGAQLTSVSSLEEIFTSQLAPVEQSSERAVDFDVNEFQQLIMDQLKEHGMNAQAVRAGIGKQALAAKTLPEEARRAIIASRLPSHEWPVKNFFFLGLVPETGDWLFFIATLK
jgi:NTE family protein